jgi:hypothetical protein
VLEVSSQESEHSCICVLGVSSHESEHSCICVLEVSSHESEHSCICVLGVSSHESEHSCICRGTDFASFYELGIGFWNCSVSVVIFVFHFIEKTDFSTRKTPGGLFRRQN